ncbi:hypothetical protein V494_05819 [Pseudogymnoascus sp. VKM F-4513 (FW-928)]|nr:hypothetical protein V494_05819 [Pseudogymnoascus sp. VKM F-4513 (FW-928)]
MPVTRSEKRQRLSSEQSQPQNNAQTSELEPNNSTSRPKKRSKKLPSGSDAAPSNIDTAPTGPKPDTGFTTPQEPRTRNLRSRSYVTSSNKSDVVNTPEVESGKSLSRSEKRSEQRRLKKLQSRSEVPSSNNRTVESELKSDLGPYPPQEPRTRNLRSRSYVPSSLISTQAPAPELDMRSYNPEETGAKKIRLRSYVSSTSKLTDNILEMMNAPQGGVGATELPSDPKASSSKNGKRPSSPEPDMRSSSSQKELSRQKKKPRLLKAAAANDAQAPQSSASNAPPRLKLNLKKPNPGLKLSQGDSALPSDGISVPFLEGLLSSTPFSQATPASAPKDLSSPLSESKSTPASQNLSSPLPGSNTLPSSEGNHGSQSEDNDSPLSDSNSPPLSRRSAAPSPEPQPQPQPKKEAAPHPETATDGVSSTPKSKSKGKNPASKIDSRCSTPSYELSPEKQGQYRAEREKEPLRVADQQKTLATMDDFKKGFRDLLTHIRAPRKNSHMKKNPNEHMFALKLSPQLALMAPSQWHAGIYVKDVCFDSTTGDMTAWVMGHLMDVVKTDGLGWGQIAIELTEGGSLGKVSNWGFNPNCSHKLETCFINSNVDILLCKKTLSAIITYHHQWKCVSFIPFFPIPQPLFQPMAFVQNFHSPASKP